MSSLHRIEVNAMCCNRTDFIQSGTQTVELRCQIVDSTAVVFQHMITREESWLAGHGTTEKQDLFMAVNTSERSMHWLFLLSSFAIFNYKAPAVFPCR